MQWTLERPRFDVEAVGPAKGPADAPITIVEFSDYQCPFCRRAEPVIEELPAGPAAIAVHTGTYETLGATHEASTRRVGLRRARALGQNRSAWLLLTGIA